MTDYFIRACRAVAPCWFGWLLGNTFACSSIGEYRAAGIFASLAGMTLGWWKLAMWVEILARRIQGKTEEPNS